MRAAELFERGVIAAEIARQFGWPNHADLKVVIHDVERAEAELFGDF